MQVIICIRLIVTEGHISIFLVTEGHEFPDPERLDIMRDVSEALPQLSSSEATQEEALADKNIV